MAKRFAVGADSFPRIRENGNYYIDKTEFIAELLKADFMVSLITRPRRFGKTLTMSMLEDFFDITRDSRAHFKGLKISQNRGICDAWMNQWPVISVSLKTVEGLDFESAYERLRVLMANVCKKYSFLGKSDCVNPADREIFRRLKYNEAAPGEFEDGFALLTRMMAAHFGKPCILLIDEYDVPLARANENGYYREMLDIVRAMFNAALKSNDNLKFAVITGCLKIAKESVFTGLNNVVSNTIMTERFDEYIGFTREDVRQILEYTGFTDHAEEIRAWYDGYRFGRTDVYCPWDVMNHIADLYVNPKALPANHWASTSHNQIIYKLFQNSSFNVNDKFETLLAGGVIREVITEDLTYDTLEASEANLWSLLFMTGYLTLAADVTPEENASGENLPRENLPGYDLPRESLPGENPSGEYLSGENRQGENLSGENLSGENLPGENSSEEIPGCIRNAMNETVASLRIPNEEVRLIFRRAIVDWFRQDVQTYDRTAMFRALWEQEAETAEALISELLFSSISYYDYRESYYHAFVAGLFAGAGYAVESNYERGVGRPDVVVLDRRTRRAMLFEVKHTKKNETLEHACEEAARQIKEKRYAEGLQGYRTVLCYGIAFKGKDCMLRVVE